MPPTRPSAYHRDLLTNDILISIFDKVNVLHRRRLARVCRRWRDLIEITLLWVTEFSAVDDRRCVADWQPSNWLSLRFVSKDDYVRIPKISASEILSRTAGKMPNLRAIDLECCDMNNRIIRTILQHCKKIERINLDSSTRLNFYSFNLMARDWARLRHVNLSCCTEVSEISAKFLIENLRELESLNLCGTKISGLCLDKLNPNMKRLDISYCWKVQETGLLALAKAPCKSMIELSVNNFDFDGSESCMVAILNNFRHLEHLQMSIGPCVAHDYFIDRLTNRGFSSIGNLSDLKTLIIEKICVMDNHSLQTILKGCSKLRHLRLNLGWLNNCTEVGFAGIDILTPDLEELHISYPSTLSCQGLSSLPNLTKLRSLSLVNTDIDNTIFKMIDKMPNLVAINFDECRKITIAGFTQLIRIANKRPSRVMGASLLGTGIIVSRVRDKLTPANLVGRISNFRATKYYLQIPVTPVIQ